LSPLSEIESWPFMKALHLLKHGDPADVVRLVELPDPRPGPEDIVIRMEAAALHLADIKIMKGEEGFTRSQFPMVPGFEGVGRVVQAGSAVTQYKVGDRVFPWWGAGTFSELVCAPAAKAIPAPEGEATQLALMLVNGMTAVVLLEDFATFAPGEWILQNGANSNCGRYLIVLAKERGVRTVNVVRRPEMIAELTALGADAVVIDSDDPKELKARVDAATGGAPLKVGIDMVAGPATNRIAHCVADNGTVVNYGYISGQRCEIHFNELFWRNVKLVGMSTSRGLAIRSMETVRAIYADLAAKIADGRLRAAIAATYPLARFAEAFAHAQRTGAERDGKIIILPNG
jgi:NADPH:quinone reductase-like Zn-dependent oxidoreductase